MMRPVWAACGLVALALGMVGIVTPLLPTVPFLLLAAFCFARSSARLHAWLVTHPVFGPPIAAWQAHGAIGRRAKWLASGSILATFAISLALGLRPAILAVQAVTLAGVAVFIWSRPDS